MARLPKGASIINFARGRIIDDKALLSHLDSGHLDHAVLDVFGTEPLPQNSPFWNHPGITVLPHIAAPTNRETASIIVAENINYFLETGNIPVIIDRKLGY